MSKIEFKTLKIGDTVEARSGHSHDFLEKRLAEIGKLAAEKK